MNPPKPARNSIPVTLRVRLILALCIGLLTTCCLARSHSQVGFVRDEGMYFEASLHYAHWFTNVLKDPEKNLKQRAIDRAFQVNREHPPAMKMAAGLSARLFAKAAHEQGKHKVLKSDRNTEGLFPVMRESTAMRLPAQILAGLGAALLFWLGSGYAAIAGGLLAAGWMFLLPRVAFHMGLHAFDGPAAVAALFVVEVYRRSLTSKRWGFALGPTLALAILMKHNALFLVPLLLAHYTWLIFQTSVSARSLPSWKFIFSLPILSLTVFAPLLVVAGWPWLWSHTFERISSYFTFHLDHAYYNMEYLGQNYNQPPMPWSYPWVMTWATVPTILLVLSCIGFSQMLGRDLQATFRLLAHRTELSSNGSHQHAWSAPFSTNTSLQQGSLQQGSLQQGSLQQGSLYLAAGLFPLVLISLPNVPIFGGTKHWLTAYPFFALASVFAWRWIQNQLDFFRLPLPAKFSSPILSVALCLVCLTPSALATYRAHPFLLSQYAPLVGGPAGAAQLGLNRGFWGYAVTQHLQNADESSRSIYLHDLHPLAEKQYRRDGAWPTAWQASSVAQSNASLMFYEMHMLSDETNVWNTLQTTRPSEITSLFGVPITSLYEADE